MSAGQLLPVKGELFPNVSHFEELVAVLRIPHATGKRAAVFRVLQVF
jgi:hypothetical protein